MTTGSTAGVAPSNAYTLPPETTLGRVSFRVRDLDAMVTFYTTRVAALFEIYMVAELMLSGRLVPMSLMPSWVQAVAAWAPFKWTFSFPIETLVGDLGTRALLLGLATQLLWIGIGAGLLALAWRAAVRRYSAVGN